MIRTGPKNLPNKKFKRHTKKIKNFTVVRDDGTIYNNERLRWPSNSLGTFRHKESNEQV